MIGFYDYTVVLTYISLMCSVLELLRQLEDITGQRLSVWHYPDYLICLMERLQEPKRTVLMMKNYLAFRLIPFAM